MISIKEKKECCGCSACYNVCSQNAIQMSSDKEGFLYPTINTELCNNCGLCEKVCPIKNKTPETKKAQKAFIVQNKDDKILKESTSGGAFTAIAEYVIDNGGVVFGAAFDDDFKVIHTYAETKKDLSKFRNSKYVQSDMGDTFKQAKDFLKEGRLVCFSGTPCQIEGLFAYLMKHYDNLITVDVVCRAVPSPLVWEKYRKMKVDGQKIRSAYFRDKSPYGYNYSQISMTFNEKRIHSGVESDSYLRAFFSNISDRPSCYSCNFRKRYHLSDITLWDCYNVYKFNKDFDDNKGTTRALVHSEKGRKIFSALEDSCRIFEITPEKAIEGVRELIESPKCNPVREQFFKDINSMETEKFFNKYFPDTIKVKLERITRKITIKLNIYSALKKAYNYFIKK